MAEPKVDNDLWQRIEPFVPPPRKRRRVHPGRKPMDPRRAFAGMLFVLRTGCAWKDLPQELGFGSGMSCWRYLRDWHKAGVFQKAFAAVLARLNAQGKINWSRGVVDSASVRAVFGGKRPARTRQTGVKRALNTTS
jgi:transposase